MGKQMSRGYPSDKCMHENKHHLPLYFSLSPAASFTHDLISKSVALNSFSFYLMPKSSLDSFLSVI